MEKIKKRHTTGGIFYCRVSAEFSVSASNKLYRSLTVTSSEIGNKNIPLSVSIDWADNWQGSSSTLIDIL